MKVVVKKPSRKAEMIEIDDANVLQELQQLVGGYIECVSIENDITLVVDEEGKLSNKTPNVVLQHDGKVVDVCVGTCVAVKTDGENIVGLNRHERRAVENWFAVHDYWRQQE